MAAHNDRYIAGLTRFHAGDVDGWRLGSHREHRSDDPRDAVDGRLDGTLCLVITAVVTYVVTEPRDNGGRSGSTVDSLNRLKSAARYRRACVYDTFALKALRNSCPRCARPPRPRCRTHRERSTRSEVPIESPLPPTLAPRRDP